jgi:hypothetical protein
MTGDRLGPWVIDAEIGRGAMGAVYRARRDDSPPGADAPGSPRVAAVKILNAELARDDLFIQRFQREIEALRQLDHPNIVHFLESGRAGGVFYYAMEYVDGPDCEAILRERGRMPWNEVLVIALQVVPALKHAHDRGIIHRDLKPANIMLASGTAPPTVKLTDFGVAKLFAQPPLTAAGSFVGTAAYLAPEQAAGRAASKRSDFYALGGVLYCLLTGRPPFPGENVAELLHKHCYAVPDRPQRLIPELPHGLDGLVMQLLEKDPARRPADGLVLLRQLERIKGKLDRQQADAISDPPRELTPTVPQQVIPALAPAIAAMQARGQGPATIAANLMRQELEAQNRGGPVARFFNHPVTLVLMLAACVGLIAWGLGRKGPTAEELYRRAEPLMQSPRPADWDRAWAESLEPLTDRFPDNPYRDEVAAFRRKMLDVREQDKALAQAKADAPHGEAERFYKLGLQHCQADNADAARRVWEGVVRSFGGAADEARWVELARRGLVQLPRLPTEDRWGPVRQALARARQLRDAGQRDEATRIWQGLEELYRNDPAAGPVLAELRRDRDGK